MFGHKRNSGESEPRNFFLGDFEEFGMPSPEQKKKAEETAGKKAAPIKQNKASVKPGLSEKKHLRAVRQMPAEKQKADPDEKKESADSQTQPVPALAKTLAPQSLSSPKGKKKKGFPKKAKRDLKKEADKAKKARALTNAKEEAVKASLDGMYEVYRDPEKNKKKTLGALDFVRYGILFVCIFGFLTAGFFVFRKLYDYYRAYVVYSGLQEMVSEKDRFADEYLKKATASVETLTPADILAGKTADGEGGNTAFTEEQETLVTKIAQLKKINADTVGWISVEGTVVNYPLVWSATRNYYLHRDFYGKTLSGGAIFIDERNSPDITQNRNTVIYGHNMSDGSMFASIHDFASSSVFYSATIEIATSEGIYVYEPFSVHESNAFDNYFETDFVSDEDYINFCEQMAFISIYQTEHTFDKNSQIITLSTCKNNETTTDQRFAVHAILTKVIR